LVKVKNYKCFLDEFHGYDEIKGMNLIIGKNNSGKSSLMQVIEILVGKSISQIKLPGESVLRIESEFTKKMLNHPFSKARTLKFNGKDVYKKDLVVLEGEQFSIEIKGDGKIINYIFDSKYPSHYRRDLKTAVDVFEHPFQLKNLRKISSERNILPEVLRLKATLDSLGTGATNYIQVFQHFEDQDRKIIDEIFLQELNEIINPDIEFKDILTRKKVNANTWEIYFENKENNLIALSQMGSGIKTVLLVLINLILVPTFEKKKKENYIYAFEELENNLHPSLQKRLFNYIIKFQEQTNSTFFLTTHSNVVIDLFSNNDNAQILHIINNTISSKILSVKTNFDKYSIINDLGYKASDILQSNGIIWVEGPSDRVYLNKWISLINPNLIDGVHYSILHYGGRLLSNLEAKIDHINKELIPILKINRNGFVLIDKDAKNTSDKLNSTKKRINDEIPESCWITDGREIENYLTKNTITKWLKELKGEDYTLSLNKLGNVGNAIEKVSKINYNSNKSKYSKQIAKHISQEDLIIYDLSDQINSLVDKIIIWNK